TTLASFGEFESVYDTGRSAADPPGTMMAAVLVQSGTAANYLYPYREGDMNDVSLDPSDGSFWATTEWYSGSGFGGICNEKVSSFTTKSLSPPVDLTNALLTVNDATPGVQNQLTISQVTTDLGSGLQDYVQVYDPNTKLTASGGAIQVDTNTVDA